MSDDLALGLVLLGLVLLGSSGVGALFGLCHYARRIAEALEARNARELRRERERAGGVFTIAGVPQQGAEVDQ